MRILLPKILAIVFFISLIVPVAASAGTSDELASLLNHMQTMRAQFTQTIYDNRGKAIQQSSGSMALMRPGKFRWEVKKPSPQVVIANNQRLWIYDPDLEQVTIRSLTSEAGEAPALLLSHENASLESIYDIQDEHNKQDLHWFTLIPKQKDNSFASVKMGFDANKALKEMLLQDQIGHSTRVQFVKIEMNSKISPDLFNFKAPAGTDVIDETRPAH